ncbi:MAG TPA: hypothetical protein VH599_06325 [Ktedonobacterales bacterium]
MEAPPNGRARAACALARVCPPIQACASASVEPPGRRRYQWSLGTVAWRANARADAAVAAGMAALQVVQWSYAA